MTKFLETARQIATDYSALPDVTAVVLAGSVGGGHADSGSDIDMYVYSDIPLPVSAREALIRQRANRYMVDNRFWETGDEWSETTSGIDVDVMFREPNWIEDQVERLLVRHEASVGYSTCFWYNVLHSIPLFDRSGWYRQLQLRARAPYPPALRDAIIAKNHPLFRELAFSAYIHQLEKAVQRADVVSINHRVSAVLASYFDIVFAVNCLPHPGEKRLIALVEKHCGKRPSTMREDVEKLLQAAGSADESILTATHTLVDHLDELLLAEGILPPAHNNIL